MTYSVLSYPKFRSVIPATNLANAGGKVYTYATGTTNPLATYADALGNTTNAQPVILDDNGEAYIWIQNTDNLAYDFIIKDKNNVVVDSIINIQDVAINNGSIVFTGDLEINNNSIIDANLKKYVKFTSSPNAANYITLTNAATTVGPSLTVTGADNNIAFTISSKGTGYVTIARATIGTVKYPTADGTSGQVLTTDGAGQLSFSTITNVAASNNVSYAFALDGGAGLTITGGSDGQSLHTHGNGNLYWASDTVNLGNYGLAGVSSAFGAFIDNGGGPTLEGNLYNAASVATSGTGIYNITFTNPIASGNVSIVIADYGGVFKRTIWSITDTVLTIECSALTVSGGNLTSTLEQCQTGCKFAVIGGF